MDVELDLGAVRAFVVVADERHFGEAAARLGVSQQAVSKRVAKLEAHFETTLLRRSGAGTGLTEDGTAFLPHARALLTLADQAERVVRRRHRSLRVDVLGTRLAATELVREFYERNPDVEIELLTSYGLRAARVALVDRTVDAAFARVLGTLDASIEFHPVHLEPLHLLVGRRHPLARRRQAGMTELRGLTAWMPGNQPGSEWADFYQAMQADFGVRIDDRGPNFGMDHLLEKMAASEDTVSFAGEGTRVPWHRDIVRIPLVRPVPCYPWSLLISRSQPHPAVPRLLADLTEAFVPLDPDRQWIPAADRPAFLAG